jgi:hypothetical protein
MRLLYIVEYNTEFYWTCSQLLNYIGQVISYKVRNKQDKIFENVHVSKAMKAYINFFTLTDLIEFSGFQCLYV